MALLWIERRWRDRARTRWICDQSWEESKVREDIQQQEKDFIEAMRALSVVKGPMDGREAVED